MYTVSVAPEGSVIVPVSSLARRDLALSLQEQARLIKQTMPSFLMSFRVSRVINGDISMMNSIKVARSCQ